MPLLKDLISIPERVHQGDFVLQLSKGVTEEARALGFTLDDLREWKAEASPAKRGCRRTR